MRKPIIKLLVALAVLPLVFESQAEIPLADHFYVSEFQGDLRGAVQHIMTLAETGKVSDALGHSSKLLSDLEQTSGAQSATLQGKAAMLLAMANVNHGIIQSTLGLHAEGLLSIAAGMQSSNDFQQLDNPLRIKALIAKGLIEMSINRLDEARESFHHAQNIVHRNEGVYSLTQQGLLGYISHLEMRQGNYEVADTLQHFALDIVGKHYGPESVEMITALNQAGRYFAQRGQMIPRVSQEALRRSHSFLGAKLCRPNIRFLATPCNPGLEKLQQRQMQASQEALALRTSRELAISTSVDMLERALALHQQYPESKDVNVNDTLRALATVHMRNGRYRAARNLLVTALQSSQQNYTSAESRMGMLMTLGDLLQSQGDKAAAGYYLDAWALLQAESELKAQYDALFKQPWRLTPQQLRSIALESNSGLQSPGEQGFFVLVGFDVSERGFAENVEIIESNVPRVHTRHIQRQFKRARFRPQIESGVIVRAEGRTHRVLYPVPADLAFSD